MAWRIALVLEHCIVGLKALTAGAEHRLWLHGSLISFDKVELLASWQVISLVILGAIDVL